MEILDSISAQNGVELQKGIVVAPFIANSGYFQILYDISGPDLDVGLLHNKKLKIKDDAVESLRDFLKFLVLFAIIGLAFKKILNRCF